MTSFALAMVESSIAKAVIASRLTAEETGENGLAGAAVTGHACQDRIARRDMNNQMDAGVGLVQMCYLNTNTWEPHQGIYLNDAPTIPLASSFHMSGNKRPKSQGELQSTIEKFRKRAEDQSDLTAHIIGSFKKNHASEVDRLIEKFKNHMELDDTAAENGYNAIVGRLDAPREEIEDLRKQMAVLQRPNDSPEHGTIDAQCRQSQFGRTECGIDAARNQHPDISAQSRHIDTKTVTAQAVQCLASQIVGLLSVTCAPKQAEEKKFKKYTKEFVEWYQHFHSTLVYMKVIPEASKQKPAIHGHKDGLPQWLPEWLIRSETPAVPKYWDPANFKYDASAVIQEARAQFNVQSGLPDMPGEEDAEIKKLRDFCAAEGAISDKLEELEVDEIWTLLCNGPKQQMS
ncbi:hypothetical protein OPT61_g5224 [Boeremia exigua]|uniref:Uncharacterized protein n=1 Tax=Boeremia exigua TaxID=749465 RepID=A0ACC2IB18_9PLEO|nr:hypothetical protein OPT61_g5224 [Boeremia exigua]